MNLTTTPSIISRHQCTTNIGIQTLRYSRNAIGYIEQGRMLIHLADSYMTVNAGELFHLNQGTYYIERCPQDSEHPFIQTIFFYTPSHLRNDFTPSIIKDESSCDCSEHAANTDIHTYPAWGIVSSFFNSLTPFITSQLHISHPELGHLKLCELIHLLFTESDCCICGPILKSLASGSQSFHDVVKANILTGVTLIELASLCDMSLSLFKIEFRNQFHSTPHKWLTQQRLTHARLQLITSLRPILDISKECLFNNSSHFIKLFKDRFGVTPSLYRRTYDR